MGLQIATNELAIGAQRHLSETNERLKHVIEKLSSGSKITKAADDAAGLAISDSLRTTIRSLEAAKQNAMDGISLVQIFEGGTTETNNLIMRIRELAMRASSDTVGEREREMLDLEVQQVKEEIERIARTTEFSGAKLLDGTVTQLQFQVGTNNDDEVDRISFDPGDTDLTLSALDLDGIDITDKVDAQDSLEVVDEALKRVNEVRARAGSAQSRLQITVRAQSVFQENLMAANSRIRDMDLAKSSSELARETVMRRAGVAVLVQANQTPALALKLLAGA